MYGEGSEFAYDEDHVIHLDGAKQDSTSKRFYKVPDTPPEHEGIEWLDPLMFDLTSFFDLGNFSQRYPNGPGWFAHLIHDDDQSEFAEHVAEYASNLLGFDPEYYYTPYDELDVEYDEINDFTICHP